MSTTPVSQAIQILSRFGRVDQLIEGNYRANPVFWFEFLPQRDFARTRCGIQLWELLVFVGNISGVYAAVGCIPLLSKLGLEKKRKRESADYTDQGRLRKEAEEAKDKGDTIRG